MVNIKELSEEYNGILKNYIREEITCSSLQNLEQELSLFFFKHQLDGIKFRLEGYNCYNLVGGIGEVIRIRPLNNISQIVMDRLG